MLVVVVQVEVSVNAMEGLPWQMLIGGGRGILTGQPEICRNLRNFLREKVAGILQKRMSVILETSLGTITIDLFVDDCPTACKNFLKLCKTKYNNL